MKKSYFFLSALFLTSLIFNSAYSQEAYVTGTVKVKVKPNTLVYFGGGLTIKDEVDEAKVVENDGNIIIKTNYANTGLDNGADGKNFVSTWTDDANYGQVIIQEGVTTASMLTMEKGAIDPSEFSWGQIAIPYNFATPNDAMMMFFGAPYNASNRYYSSMMKWDNLQKPEFDHLASAGTGATGLEPADYVILNLTYFSGNILAAMTDAFDGEGKLPYSGVPTNQVYSKTLNIASYPDPDTYTTWNSWRSLKNSYNERYYTYIFDDIRDAGSDNYGRNFFQFGNPYTSNIDLSYIGTTSGIDDGVFIDKLMSVSKINDENWTDDHDPGSQASVVTSTIRAVWDGDSWSGNPSALIIKPFEPFIIGLYHDAARSTQTFDFNDKLKTFLSEPGAGSSLPATGGDIDGKMINNSLLSSFSATSTTKNVFYQLGLHLYDANDNNTNNEVYVVVASSSKVQNGVNNRYESEYADFDGRTGFYSVQENADGSEITTPGSRKLYINAVNVKYAAKPIQLFFNRKSSDTGGYYLKADLFYGNIFNKLSSEDINYPGNNSFYFYDKFEDVLLPVTTDFSYYIELSDNPVESRYQVYWNGGPQNQNKMNSEDEILPASQTFIYKDQEKQMVRFNEEWTSAEIKVYDLSGRNILTHEGVKTDSDFELQIPAKGVFVVKILSNTGEVYTQKIINQ